MPRSDSGRVAARGWSEGCTENRRSIDWCRGRTFCATQCSLGFCNGRSRYHGFAWDRRPAPVPPLLSRGSENVQISTGQTSASVH